MQYTFFIIALLRATAVTAQSGVPACASSCVTLLPAGCSSQDIGCICGSKQFISDVSCCVSQKCSLSDQSAALQYIRQICLSGGVSTLALAAVCPATSSTSSPGSTAGSQPTSVATPGTAGAGAGAVATPSAAISTPAATTPVSSIATSAPRTSISSSSQVTAGSTSQTTSSSTSTTSQVSSASSPSASQTPASASPTLPQSAETSASDNGLPLSTKIGLGLGIGLGVALIVALVALWRLSRRQRQPRESGYKYDTQPGTAVDYEPGVAWNESGVAMSQNRHF